MSTLNEFLKFVKEELKINITARKSDNPDTFEKIFGFSVYEMRHLTPEEMASYKESIFKNNIVTKGVNVMDLYEGSDAKDES